MNNRLLRTWFVLGIIFLFIGAFVTPCISENIKINKKLVFEVLSNEKIEDINGLKFDNKGYIINNYKVREGKELINSFTNDPGEINPIWSTIEDLGYIFYMKNYKDCIYAIGYKYIPEDESSNAILAKFNATDGELSWVETWEGYHPCTWAIDLEIFNDSIYIVGYTGPPGFVLWWLDSFICKYDLDGNLIWSRLINETKIDYISGIKENINYLYLCGSKDSTSWILKYDTDGNKIWGENYKILGTWFSEFLDLEIYNGYIYTEGQTDSNDKTRQDVLTAKISMDGKLIWKKEWGGEGPQLGAKMDVKDGSIYVCGYGHSSYSMDSPSYDVLLRYNTEGELQWNTNADTNSMLLDIKVYNESIYATGGIWRNYPYDVYGDAVLQKYDTDGRLIWYLTYGENYITDYARCIDPYNYFFYLCGLSGSQDFILNYDVDLFSDNNKPDAPSKPSGQARGIPGTIYDYTAVATDPDNDLLSYCFSWDDENVTITEWMSSGQTGSSSHSWTERGRYNIRARARDECGFVSDWSDPLLVNIPRNRATYYSFFNLFLELFPMLERLLNLIRFG